MKNDKIAFTVCLPKSPFAHISNIFTWKLPPLRERWNKLKALYKKDGVVHFWKLRMKLNFEEILRHTKAQLEPFFFFFTVNLIKLNTFSPRYNFRNYFWRFLFFSLVVYFLFITSLLIILIMSAVGM